jgi:NADH-ubiquinone oxidoreductase chain 5
MALPLFLLSFFSLSVGFYTHDIFIGLGTDFWDYSITILSENYSVRDIEFIPSITKLTPLFFTLLGTFLSYFIYSYFLNNFFELKNFALYRIFHNFFSRKWYFDRIYNQVFSKNILSISLYQYYINFDRGILEHVGPLGVAFSTEKLSSSIISLQNGNVRSYLEFLVFTFFYFCFFYCWYLGLNNPFETFFIFSSLFLLHLFFNLKKF